MKNTHTLAGLVLAVTTAPLLAAGLPNLAEVAAQNYLEQARFPQWSGPVLDAVDPILRERTPSRLSMAGPEGQAPALQSWTDAIRYQVGDEVAMFARLEGAASAGWAIQGRLQSSLGTIVELDFLDNGEGADALAGDGIHSASITLPKAHQPSVGTADNLRLQLTATGPDGAVRKAINGFLFSHPGAELTGVFKPEYRDGNLLLLAETEVLARGRYHLRGVLADSSGLPLASAQNAAVLEPGRQWLELPFYGLIFHELGSLGGLQLASVTLTTTGSMPNALGPVLSNALAIDALDLTRLSAQPFADPDLLEAARRLRAPAVAVEKPAPVQSLARALSRTGL